MNFKELNIETWKALDSSGNTFSGYKSIWLSKKEGESSILNLFKDETGRFHLTIEVADSYKKLINPNVNGLIISRNQYRLHDNARWFIDIRCNQSGYLEEFTQVTKEICYGILINDDSPVDVVNEVVTKWITFWHNQKRVMLSEEQQIGLICELKLLQEFCKINPLAALNSWVGPFAERHDFLLPSWSFEVKSTRKGSRIHTINGLDQLKPFPNKSLGFISFLISISASPDSVSLPESIDKVYELLGKHPELIAQFNDLLMQTGYSPINNDTYLEFKIELLEGALFIVDGNFPCLSTDSISVPFLERISNVRYDISLEGLISKNLNELSWDKYIPSQKAGN